MVTPWFGAVLLVLQKLDIFVFLWMFNPYHANVSFLYPLKTPENSFYEVRR